MPVHRRVRDLPGALAKVGLAAALTVTLGGYAAAESATQERAAVVAGLELRAQAEAEAHRQAVAAERQRAVASAEDAIADAAAVRTVAAPAVTEAELASLTEAVDALHELLGDVPATPAGVEVPAGESADATDSASDADATDPASDADAAAAAAAAAPVTVVDREVRASRAAPRAAVPTDVAGAEAVEETAEKTSGTGRRADGGVDDATAAATPADDAAPDDALAAKILAAVARVTEVAAHVQATAESNIAAEQAAAAAAAAQAEAEAQAAAAAAAAAAEKAAQRASLDAYANGRVPASALCDIGGGHQLRCDAADSLAAMNAAYQAQFGAPLTISDSYRSYAAQVACRQSKGGLCAVPGTSNHGRGVAVDLAGGVQTFGTSQHEWMAANAAQWGWDLPDWASRGGSKPEPWHWEYIG